MVTKVRRFNQSRFGDAELGVLITDLEMIGEGRALVASRMVIDGEPSAIFVFDPALWVFEDGSWRSADDCEAFWTA